MKEMNENLIKKFTDLFNFWVKKFCQVIKSLVLDSDDDLWKNLRGFIKDLVTHYKDKP